MSKFIHVSGMSGVGKTTLVRAILNEEEFTDLRYLMTFTDRPQREEEWNGSHEYCFVNASRFDDIRDRVGENDWYEVETLSGRKGVDVGYHRKLLEEGRSLILNSYPDPEVIALVKGKFPEVEHKIVFLETNPEIVQGRLSRGSEHEQMRLRVNSELSSEMLAVRGMCDVRLECIGSFERDFTQFCEVVRELLREGDTIDS